MEPQVEARQSKVTARWTFLSLHLYLSPNEVYPCMPRLVHSADEYNLHGAKLSASCPSVKQDGENKWFLHTDCFT